MKRNVLISISTLANTPRDGSWVLGFPLAPHKRQPPHTRTFVLLTPLLSGLAWVSALYLDPSLLRSPAKACESTPRFPEALLVPLGLHGHFSPSPKIGCLSKGSQRSLTPSWSPSVSPGSEADSSWGTPSTPPRPHSPPSLPRPSPSPWVQARPGIPPPSEQTLFKGLWRLEGIEPPPTRTAHLVCSLPAAGTPAQIPADILLLNPDPQHTYLPPHLHPRPKPLPFGLVVDAPGSLS
eukprot:XP_024309033.1 sine oculis-binding protein homolog [Homo sapiens]